MTYEFCLPDVGEGITESDLLKWHVKPGDVVREDDLLCEIETDKAVVEIPVPCNGAVQSLQVAEGTTVKVGSVIAVFATADNQAASAAAVKSAAHAMPAEPRESQIIGVSPAPTFSAIPQAAPAQPVHATPSTRSYARQQGVVLERVVGSGPKGRILREDIDRHLSVVKAPDASSVRLEVRPLAIPLIGQQRRTPIKGFAPRDCRKPWCVR